MKADSFHGFVWSVKEVNHQSMVQVKSHVFLMKIKTLRSNIPFDEFEIPPPLKLTIESLIKMCLSVT